MENEITWVFSGWHDGPWCDEDYKTREEAIEAGRNVFCEIDENGHAKGSFYVAEKTDPGLAPLDFGVLIGEEIEECHSDLAGDNFDGFSFNFEHVKELNEGVRDVVEKWMNKYQYWPNYFLIDKFERIDAKGEGDGARIERIAMQAAKAGE